MSIAPTFATKDDADRGTGLGGEPGDDEAEANPDAEHEHAEENTYNLPQGDDLRRELTRWVHRQMAEVLGEVESLGADLPATHGIRPLAHWDAPMAEAMTPMLGAYWDASGKATLARLGLDPDDWRVTNPHLRATIERAAYDFCHSTNATTTKRLDDALAELRREMAEGQVERGETLRELTGRVKGVFEGLSTGRARTIAATEASRAVHAAQLEADRQSGVVAGLRLLLSGDACPLCRRIFNECRQVPLGHAFATIGDNPTYSTIRHPPLHVHCLLPETPIVAPGRIAGVEVQYDGPAVRLEFSDGSKVAVTPNHMLLTPTGFAPAQALMKGDDVVRCELGQGPDVLDPDDDRQPSRVDEVVHSLAVSGGVIARAVPVAPEYLHGDGLFCDGNVHVVTADGLLRRDDKPASPEAHDQLPFGVAVVDRVGLASEGGLESVLIALRDATDGGMRRIRESRALLWARSRHAERVGFRLGTNPGTALDQPPTDDLTRNAEIERDGLFGLPGFIPPDDFGGVDPGSLAEIARDVLPVLDRDSLAFHTHSQASPGHADRLRERLEGLAGLVATCQVVNVEFFHYVGPVYDVETVSSLYTVSGGIVSSNCQCTAIEVLTPEHGGPENPEWGVAVDRPDRAPKPVPTAAQAGSLGVAFEPSPQARAGKDPTVAVDVAAVDEAWRRDEAYYVPPGGRADDPQKYRNAVEFLRRAQAEGTPVEQPRATVDEDGTVSFVDGRHRFAAMRDLGATEVPLSVDRPQAARMRRRYGVPDGR